MAYLTQYSSSVPVIKYPIEQILMTIGQDFNMDICVPEDGIAENHAAVEAVKYAESYRFTITSTENDTLLKLNGETVSQAELQDGDWLIIGEIEFQFTDDGIDLIVSETESIPTSIVVEKTKPLQKAEDNDSEALTLIKELKEDLQDVTKPLTTKEFIANSRHRQRRFAY